MIELKNWIKTRENIEIEPKQWGKLNKLIVEYVNKENPNIFVRIWFDDSINEYAVIYGKEYVNERKYFETWQEAIKFAMDWMKRHRRIK